MKFSLKGADISAFYVSAILDEVKLVFESEVVWFVLST